MKGYFNITKRALLWATIGVFMSVASRALFFLSAQFSEEFTGGLSIVFEGKVESDWFVEGINNHLHQQDINDFKLSLEESAQETKLKVNTKLDVDQKVEEISNSILEYLLDQKIIPSKDAIIEQAIVEPSVGAYMKKTAMQALGFWILAMVIYMIFSFWAIRKYVPPVILALVVVVTTIIDISIPAGAYGLWMSVDATVQIDTVFIIAILTIIGYGINDVIVIFDRVRENMMKDNKKNISYAKIFEDSIWQTMKRSIGTSLSTLLVLLAMFIFGTGVIQKFSFIVGVGVATSFFASIFIGVPCAYLLMGIFDKSKK